MKDADGVDVVDPTSTEDVLDGHYTEALWRIREQRVSHEAHRDAADRAWRAEDPGTSGRERAYADVAMTEWTRALGAAVAIESIADTLGVPLAYDRRQWGEM